MTETGPAPAGPFFCLGARSYGRMIPDLDIYRTANVLIREHGAGAGLEAARCAVWVRNKRSTHMVSPTRTRADLLNTRRKERREDEAAH